MFVCLIDELNNFGQQPIIPILLKSVCVFFSFLFLSSQIRTADPITMQQTYCGSSTNQENFEKKTTITTIMKNKKKAKIQQIIFSKLMFCVLFTEKISFCSFNFKNQNNFFFFHFHIEITLAIREVEWKKENNCICTIFEL